MGQTIDPSAPGPSVPVGDTADRLHLSASSTRASRPNKAARSRPFGLSSSRACFSHDAAVFFQIQVMGCDVADIAVIPLNCLIWILPAGNCQRLFDCSLLIQCFNHCVIMCYLSRSAIANDLCRAIEVCLYCFVHSFMVYLIYQRSNQGTLRGFKTVAIRHHDISPRPQHHSPRINATKSSVDGSAALSPSANMLSASARFS